MLKKNKNVVYAIINNTNQKMYIGSTASLTQRLAVHRYELKNKIHGNKAMQEDYDARGWDDFSVTVLTHLDEEAIRADLFREEQLAITAYTPEYNLIVKIWDIGSKTVVDTISGNLRSQGHNAKKKIVTATHPHLPTVVYPSISAAKRVLGNNVPRAISKGILVKGWSLTVA